MALTCPRCSTDVPETAMYCPYCNLPKPKRGFAPAVTEAQAVSPPDASPVVRRAERQPSNTGKPESARPSNTKKPEATRASNPRKPSSARPRSMKVPVVGALVALVGIGVYFFVVPLVYSDAAEPKMILAALETLRKMPSNEEGVTIDARLTRELERSKKSGNLRGYQGWTVKSVSKSKVLLIYSFEEKDNTQHRAEWLADLSRNTFAPQNELAVLVSR